MIGVIGLSLCLIFVERVFAQLVCKLCPEVPSTAHEDITSGNKREHSLSYFCEINVTCSVSQTLITLSCMFVVIS